MNIRIYSHKKNDTNMIRMNIRTGKYSNIFEYPNIRHTLVEESRLMGVSQVSLAGGGWRGVCSSNWTEKEATVICRN